jgi:hypothetical protein
MQHLVPLLHEGFLEKHFEGISFLVTFIFSHHERSLGHARYYLLKRNKLEILFFVP